MDYSKLELWRKTTQDLASVKALEMKLRKELFKENFQAPAEGVNSIELQDGWQLKVNVPYTRSLDQDKAPGLLKALKKTAPDLIKTKYELSAAEYRKLDEATLTLVDAALTTKPGTPSMELIAPVNQ